MLSSQEHKSIAEAMAYTQSMQASYQSQQRSYSALKERQQHLQSTISDSDEFLTDLSDDETFLKKSKQKKDQHKHVGQRTYHYACIDSQTSPQNRILEELNTTELNIKHRNLGYKGIRSLCIALRENRHVNHLDISDNDSGDKGTYYLAAMLMQNSYINVLNASSNGIGLTGAAFLGDMLRKNSGLYKVDFSNNHFGEEAIKYIASGLEGNIHILTLNLSNNDMCEQGAVFMGKALQLNDTMEQLDISWNHIRRKGAVAIFKALQINSTLVNMNISWNGLGYEGALALKECLKTNKTLATLDVSNNRINWDGAKFIADGLKVNKTLEILKIGENPLTTNGAQDLIDNLSMADESKLRILDLKGVQVIVEFELMARAIADFHPFEYIHGGVVPTHDVLGQRKDRDIPPLQRVINFMKEKELRVTELFRAFDKSVSSIIDQKDFQKRLLDTGVNIAPHEMREMMEKIAQMAGKKDIDYQTLVGSVKSQIEDERLQKIRERDKQKKIEKYNQKILSDELPPISKDNAEANRIPSPLDLSAVVNDDTLSRQLSTRSFPTLVNSQTTVTKSVSERSTKPTVRPAPRVLSMSTQLGSKSKAFGQAEIKKKKKKKKKKK